MKVIDKTQHLLGRLSEIIYVTACLSSGKIVTNDWYG